MPVTIFFVHYSYTT